MITQTEIIIEVYSRFPVAVSWVSHANTLNIILFSSKVPHEISPVHPVDLIIKEEANIFTYCWRTLPAAILIFANSSPACVIICMSLIVALIPHSWQKMLICICIYVFYFLSVFFIFAIRSYISFGCFCILYLCSEILSKKNRPVAVLLSAYISNQTNGIVYIKHINTWICIASYHCCEIGRES